MRQLGHCFTKIDILVTHFLGLLGDPKGRAESKPPLLSDLRSGILPFRACTRSLYFAKITIIVNTESHNQLSQNEKYKQFTKNIAASHTKFKVGYWLQSQVRGVRQLKLVFPIADSVGPFHALVVGGRGVDTIPRWVIWM